MVAIQSGLSARELTEINAANASNRQPVVFVHGLWLLAGSWDAWRPDFESRGYATVAVDWPDDPATVAEARKHPEVFAGKSVQGITDHVVEVIRALTLKPIVIGHSFGGLIVQKIAGMGLAAVTVAIDPAPVKGVLPVPFSALKVASTVVANPRNYRRQVMLTSKQFRYGFGNAVSAAESDALYSEFSVPGSGIPLFQAVSANINPRSRLRTDFVRPDRGPLLVVSGGSDHTVPPAISKATFNLQSKNPGITEFYQFEGRGHSLVVDAGWHDVADVVAAFVARAGEMA